MKNECKIVKDLLPLYVDQVCSMESKEMVEAHINTCADCAKLMGQIKATMEIPMDTDASDVKGFQKFVKKSIWKRAVLGILVFVIAWVALNWAITLNVSEIWPKFDPDSLPEYLEIVKMKDGYYLHQKDLMGFGQIVDISTFEEAEAGILKIYLGEQGLTSLDPTGLHRMWPMSDRYTKLYSHEAVPLKKVIYCHKNGTEVITLWEDGQELPLLEEK